MSDQNQSKVEVVLSANIKGLIDGLNQAQSAVKANADGMKAGLAGLGSSIAGLQTPFAQAAAAMQGHSAAMQGLVSGLAAQFQRLPGPAREGARGVTAAAEEMKGGLLGVGSAAALLQSPFASIAHVVEGVKAPLLGLVAVLGGGKLFGEAIREATHWTGEVKALSLQMGISTEKASGLAVALHGIGQSTDTYRAAAMRLQMALRTQEDLLHANQVATRDSGGAMLGIDQVLQNVLGRMRELREGYDRNALAQLAFGRSAMEMQGLQRLTNERLSEGAERAKQLGLVVTGQGVTSARAYKEAIAEVGLAMEAVQVRIGAELLPRLTKLGLWFGEHGPALINPVVSAMTGLADVMSSTGFKVGAGLLALNALKPALLGAGTSVLMLGNHLRFLGAMAAGEGVVGLRALAGAVGGMLNPWLLAAVAIGGAVYALERWSTAAERAAESARKVARAVMSTDREIGEQLEKLAGFDATAKGSGSSGEKAKAAEQMKATVEGLVALNPELKDALVYEANGNLNVAATQEKVNEKRRESLRLQAAELDAKKRGLETKRDDLLSGDMEAQRRSIRLGAARTGIAFDDSLVKPTREAVEAAKQLDEEIRKTGKDAAAVKLSLANLTPDLKPTGMGDVQASQGKFSKLGDEAKAELASLRHKYAAEEVRIDDEAAKAKAKAQKDYGQEAAQFVTAIERNAAEAKNRIREQKEQEHQDVMRRYALTGADERKKIEAELAAELAKYDLRYKQAARTQGSDSPEAKRLLAERDAAKSAGGTRLSIYDREREIADLRMQLEDVKANAGARIALEEEVVRKTVAIHGEGTDQAKKARHDLTKVIREAAQEEERLEAQAGNAARDRAASLLDVEAQAIQRRRAALDLGAEEELAALRELEDRKLALKVASVQAEQRVSGLTPEQTQTLLDKEQGLYVEHYAKVTELAARAREDLRKDTETVVGAGVSGAFSTLNEGIDQFKTGSKEIDAIWKSVARSVLGIAEKLATAKLTNLLMGEPPKPEAPPAPWTFPGAQGGSQLPSSPLTSLFGGPAPANPAGATATGPMAWAPPDLISGAGTVASQSVASSTVANETTASATIANATMAQASIAALSVASAQLTSLQTVNASAATMEVATLNAAVMNGVGGGGAPLGPLAGLFGGGGGGAGAGAGGLDAALAAAPQTALASGGPVEAGKRYLVGEDGPEPYATRDGKVAILGLGGPGFFTAPAAGRIFPAGTMKAASAETWRIPAGAIPREATMRPGAGASDARVPDAARAAAQVRRGGDTNLNVFLSAPSIAPGDTLAHLRANRSLYAGEISTWLGQGRIK